MKQECKRINFLLLGYNRNMSEIPVILFFGALLVSGGVSLANALVGNNTTPNPKEETYNEKRERMKLIANEQPQVEEEQKSTPNKKTSTQKSIIQIAMESYSNKPPKNNPFLPTISNEVVLMSTLNRFPWAQIDKEIVKMSFFIEANVGPQNSFFSGLRSPEKDTFEIVKTYAKDRTNQTFDLYVNNNTLTLYFLGARIQLVSIPAQPPTFPTGNVRCQFFVIFSSPTEFRIEAKGCVSSTVGAVIKEVVNTGSRNIRQEMALYPGKLYKGQRVTTLQTKVSWTGSQVEHNFSY